MPHAYPLNTEEEAGTQISDKLAKIHQPTHGSQAHSFTLLAPQATFYLPISSFIFPSPNQASGGSSMQVPRRKYPFGPPSEPSLAVAKLAATYMRKGGNFPILVVVLTVFVFGLLMYSEDIKTMAEYSLSRNKAQDDARRAFPDADRGRPAEDGADVSESAPGRQQSDAEKRAEIAGTNATAAAAVNLPETCDLARGEWVFDDVNYPLYREDQCQFLSQQMSCLQNGRRETMYQKWRWQPSGCSLPKFDARLLLEWLRGKRMMFVGDSINRNQWESIVCLLQTVVPPELRSRRVEGPRIIFEVKDYSASIEFYWAPFLVESNSDDPKIHSIAVRVIKADSIEKHAVHWKGADVLVFNTYIWWMNTPWMRVLRPGAKNWTENDEIVRPEAYERVMKTLTNWLDQNMDPNKSSVFFMSMSPLHIKSSDWGNREGIKCAKETLPIKNMTGVYVGTDMSLFKLAKKVTGSSTARVPVKFIDITAMSEFRKDAHTSVYTVRQGALITPEQQAKPAEFADCIHWCLPGLPDTWNQILYVHLLSGRYHTHTPTS